MTRPTRFVVIVLIAVAVFSTGCKPRTPLAKTPSDMVFVPAGTDQSQRSDLRVGAFFIDRNEITNARYDRCVKQGGCPVRKAPLPASFAGPDQPAVDLPYDHAWAFCRFEGKILPTEGQWRRAARRLVQKAFEGGHRANDLGTESISGFRFTFPVGAVPRDRSAVGAMDMAGNISEFVEGALQAVALSAAENAATVALGGSFLSPPQQDLTQSRQTLPDRNFTALWLGFRCARKADGE